MDEPKPSNNNLAADSDGPLPRPAGGQVMDIKSSFNSGGSAPVLPESNSEAAQPDSTNDAVADAPAADAPDAASAPETDSSASAEEALSPSEPISEPIQSTPNSLASETAAPTSINVTNSDDDKPSEEPAVSDSGTTNTENIEHSPLAIPPVATKKKGSPILVIVIALIVAVALAGLVMYTFMKKKDSKGAKTANSVSTQTAAKPLASPADVDSTSKDIETGLSKVDNSKDFSAADLSDKSLGL